MSIAVIIRKKAPGFTRRKPNQIGGVGQYYRAIENHLSNDIRMLHFYSNRRNQNLLMSLLLLTISYLKILFELLTRKKQLYVLNLSLDKTGIIRDGIIALLFRLFRRKFIVFFRGWHPKTEKKIDRSRTFSRFLKISLFAADRIIVLSSVFKSKLNEWGYNKDIKLETTTVNETLLDELEEKDIVFSPTIGKRIRILFLGKIIRAKGIYELVDALSHLSEEKRSEIDVALAGDGKEIDAVKQITRNKGLSIEFPGYVVGESKKQLLKNSDVFLFVSHHEGMPNAVLEAMAFGLPVITTRVGGIPDFFEDGKMGFLLDNRDPKHIAEKIEYLLEHPKLMKEISEYNYNYAKEHFYASKVAKRLEKIINDVCAN